jgi:hypothetical protein
MKAFDARFASPFRVDWIEPLDRVAQDDYARAVAEKAEVLLRSAAFLDLQRDTAETDLEVRVWLEAACGPACVSITWEPGARRYGFYLLDETLRDRLGCVVFDELPCVDARESAEQGRLLLDAALRAMRVPVQEGPQPDAGAEP